MFAKIFVGMYDGSLATVGPWQALVTFQQLLVLCDKNGVVDMTPEAISRRTTVPLEIIEKGIDALEQPDRLSRDPAMDGKRITRIRPNTSWGWRIVNYTKYSAIRSADERAAYQHDYYVTKRKPSRAKIKSLALGHALPEWLDAEQFSKWMLVRPARARTAEAQQAAVAKLEKFKAEGHDPNAIVRESLANGWQGLFELKPGANGSRRVIEGVCKFCDKPATGEIRGVLHCDTPRHIDQAHDWARNSR